MEKVLRSRAVRGRVMCERCVMRKRCECVCVKEIYVKEVCVTGLCAAEIYLEELCAKERCVRVLCVTVPRPTTEKQRRCHQVPRLPCQSATPKCHACHTYASSMAPRATPATQKSRGATQSKARHQSQPSAVNATPATQRATLATQIEVAVAESCVCVWQSCM